MDGDFDGESVGLFVGDFEGLSVGGGLIVGLTVGGGGGIGEQLVPMQSITQELSVPGMVTQEPANTVTSIPAGSTAPVLLAPAIASCSTDITFPVNGLNVILTAVTAKAKMVWNWS